MSSERYKRRLHRISDGLTEGLIYFAILFGPWAFGTTQPWSIQVMNGVGLALGLLWLIKLGLRCAKRNAPSAVRPAPGVLRERRFTWLLAAGTLFILLYCLIGAWNARAIYHPDQWSFEYRNAVSWLLHSYERDSSWAAFWKYLGLAGLFWALRDWLLTLSPKEAASVAREGVSALAGTRLPVRLRRLFWVLAVNGTVLAFQGLMQRTEGGDRLLWLVEPHIHKSADTQFGPYAYRSNAAQYFNLLWPAVLGFWWAGVSSLRGLRSSARSDRQKRLAVLLPCVLIMAICPLVSASRGGAIVMVGSLVLGGAILLLAQWRKHWLTKAGLLLG